jgi:ribosomal protein L29
VATATKRYPPPTPRQSDFYTWALESADAIRQGRFEGVDWDAVAEELEDMGRSERRALENRFEVLLAHLIRWRFQQDHRSASWTGTIKEQRRKGARLLRQNPGLKSLIPELISDAYDSARALAERDTGINEANFPASCPWTVGQILDEDYLPESG